MSASAPRPPAQPLGTPPLSPGPGASPGFATHAKLTLLWFFTLGPMGFFLPYFALYLREDAGLDGVQLGTVAAVLPLVGLTTQMLWGQLADRTGSRTRTVALIATGAACGYAALGTAASFPAIVLATAFLAIFSTALIPNVVGVTLAVLGDGAEHAFGRVRVGGTIGFGVCVLSLPPLLAWSGLSLGLVFPLLAGSMLVVLALTLTLPATGAVALRAEPGAWRVLLRHAPFRRVVFASFCIFLCSQGPIALFPLLVQAQGGGVEAISRMWLLMLTLEVPLVIWFGATHARFGLKGLILIGCIASAARWCISGFVDDLQFVTWAQLLHGVSVWGVILTLPVYVDAVVPQRLRSTGQSALATLGIGLPSVLSNLASGWLVDSYDEMAPARVGGVGLVIVACALLFILPPAHRPEE